MIFMLCEFYLDKKKESRIRQGERQKKRGHWRYFNIFRDMGNIWRHGI